MTEFKQDERVGGHLSASRFTDIAFPLRAGGPLVFFDGGRRIAVPIEKELRLERSLRSNGDRVELQLELSWRAAGE